MRVIKRGQPSSRMGIVRHAIRVGFATGTLIALSACGGGGGGGSSPPPAQPPANPPPANRAPVVDAGADQAVQLPAGLTVTGTASDPDGTTPTLAWSAAPADGVTFATASAASTAVTFTNPGSYTLTLSASDGSLSATDALVVTVTAAAGGAGAPVVSAGDDQSIDYPRAATLSGSATDDSTTLTYSWTADNANVTFADAAAAATTANFSAPGTYQLTLTANDGTQSGTDSVQVTVTEPLYPAADTNTDAQHGWTFAAAADVGMDETLLQQAEAYALTAGGAGVIVRHGRVVRAWGEIDQRMAVQSTTKSIGGMALGLALKDGIVELTDFAQEHMATVGVNPDPLTQPVNNPDWLADITVLHLATHSAGFLKPGGYVALNDAPGTVWRYSDAGLNWLADMLTDAFEQDLEVVLLDRVWSVLGVSEGHDVEWRPNALRSATNAAGFAQRELASGITINAQTMARVGLLFLREGKWGADAVFADNFDDIVRTPDPSIAALPVAAGEEAEYPASPANYGVLWWTNATGALPNVPTDAYWAWGQGDSLIVVIPSLDIVISRVGPIGPTAPGRVWGEQNWNGDYAVLAPFLDPIVQSVQE